MNLKKRLISFLLILSLFLTSCEHFSIPTNANTAFQNFTLCLFQQEVCANTVNLHYSLQEPEKFGITDIPITFGSFDLNEISALSSIENWDAALHKFSYNALSKENQLTYDILSYYFSAQKKDIAYYLYEDPLSPLTGIHTQLPVLLAEYQFSSKKDVDNYLALLKTMPDYFSSLVRFERQKVSASLFMSDAAVDTVVEQCNAFISMGDGNYLISTFEERLDDIQKLSQKERSDYLQENKTIVSSAVLTAYEQLASSLLSLKGSGRNTQGLCYFPQGKEYYAHLVASETGSDRTISQLKALIQNQLDTDVFDSQQILNDPILFSEEANAFTESPENILKTLEHKISSTFPSSASVNVNIKYVPDALQEYLSPAFYLIPAIDNFEKNTIYINQAYSLDDIHLFTTLAHEGYPGHLYQTTYFANTNPDPIRSLLNFSGYVEGWATYAEMCSYYISPLNKPQATLLQKNNSFILGLYATADIGIHYDGWSLEDTILFFEQYGISDSSTIQEIYEYIVGDPANYLTYYVGYLEMLELKKEMISAKGNSFSQKEFHQKVLEIGPAPFDIIKKHLY